MSGSSTLNMGEVEAGLAGTMFAGQVHALASVGSTNALALEAAQEGAATGVWVADEQTAGRGRGGHTWHSAAGDGLYVSALLRPQLVGAEALKLSLAAGIAAHRAVESVAGMQIDVRWPNDLMVTPPDGVERKFGGILTESAMQGEGELAYAVVGIGMNLNHARLPEELAAIATSLRLSGGHTIRREPLLVALLRALAEETDVLEAEMAGRLPARAQPLAARFGAVSTWVRGLRVHVAEGDGYTGVTDGLDPHGLLQVRLQDGRLATVRHGGVRRA